MRFGTDGVRGVANRELTVSFALDLGRAAAKVLGASRAVVGGDSRVSTPMLEAALVAGLASEGVEVIRLGVVPTPAVAYHAARLGAMGAVVSASHNPYHDNGIKLFSVGGSKLADDVEAEIEMELTQLNGTDAAPAPIRRLLIDPYTDGYVDHLLDVLGGRGLDGMAVVVDAANGAASELAGPVFERAGAAVDVICAEPDGVNINEGCGATDPEQLCRRVRAHGAAVGIALDGDADRLIAVDETGAVVDGDHIIAICAADMHERGVLHADTVVVTVMTNLGFRLAMQAAGVHVVETSVGDRYVLEALQQGGFSLGGEQSGHVIFADRATTGDGMLTALALLDVMHRRGRPLSELAAEAMTQLPQVLVNIEVAERHPDIGELLAADIAEVEATLGETGRVLVRPSGTEPLVRVMVEAATAEQAREAAERLAAVIRRRYAAARS